MSYGNKVHTRYGKVKGAAHTTDDGKNYAAFFGVPYAKQPFGDLRFRDPQPLEPWTGELDATRGNYEAHQAVFSILGGNKTSPEYIGSDHCLVLNIYTPNLTGKLPVFVWIHGGGYLAGSNTIRFFGPDYFVEKNIIVVTMNYRLSVVGFLSFADESLGIPGNAGLKDQSMALRWIKENISCFGGDPDAITLGGQSSGAASVHYHLVSPMSAGLFKRAILHSGAAFIQWAMLPENEHYEYELARKLGWNGEGGDRGAFEVISQTNIEKLVLTAQGLVKDLSKIAFGSVSSSPFLPRIEPYNSKMCFLAKPVVELGRSAWSKDVDVIIGGNKDEGYYFETKYKEFTSLLHRDFAILIPNYLRLNLNDAEKAVAVSMLKQIYFNKEDVNLDDFSLEKFLEIMCDLQYWHGIYRLLNQREQSKGKTFHYFLASTVDPQIDFYKYLRKVCYVPHMKGSGHGDDLALIWKSMFSKKPAPGNKIYRTFVRFFGAYSNFIKTGNPNNSSLEVHWKPIGDGDVECEGYNCCKFTDDSAEMVPSPYGKRLSAWSGIYRAGDYI